MKWEAQIESPKPRRFVIERQKLTSLMPSVPDQYGYYLYVYEDGKDIYDYLQDTFEITVDQAFEQFGVPKDIWRQVEEPDLT
ncbi:MAG: hypothetical protein WDO70_08720 [Alphaproteobacteria bacterium]